jgi:hypothetical protein
MFVQSRRPDLEKAHKHRPLKKQGVQMNGGHRRFLCAETDWIRTCKLSIAHRQEAHQIQRFKWEKIRRPNSDVHRRRIPTLVLTQTLSEVQTAPFSALIGYLNDPALYTSSRENPVHEIIKYSC